MSAGASGTSWDGEERRLAADRLRSLGYIERRLTTSERRERDQLQNLLGITEDTPSVGICRPRATSVVPHDTHFTTGTVLG